MSLWDLRCVFEVILERGTTASAPLYPPDETTKTICDCYWRFRPIGGCFHRPLVSKDLSFRRERERETPVRLQRRVLDRVRRGGCHFSFPRNGDGDFLVLGLSSLPPSISLRDPVLGRTTRAAAGAQHRRRSSSSSRLALLGHGLGQAARAPAPADPAHEVGVTLRQDGDVGVDVEGVEEGARALALVLGVLHGAHVRAHHDLHAGAGGAGGGGLGVGHAGGDVEDGADGDGLFEGGRVEVEEARARVADGGGAGEGEFEGCFEEKAAEDHEVVAVPVLGLHYLG